MPKRYYIAEAGEVFSEFFMSYIQNSAGLDGLEKKDVIQIMNQIETYEDKHNRTFIAMIADGILIFRNGE